MTRQRKKIVQTTTMAVSGSFGGQCRTEGSCCGGCEDARMQGTEQVRERRESMPRTYTTLGCASDSRTQINGNLLFQRPSESVSQRVATRRDTKACFPLTPGVHLWIDVHVAYKVEATHPSRRPSTRLAILSAAPCWFFVHPPVRRGARVQAS